MDSGIEVSILLPVRNGGAYFRQCVLSILAQTYQSFNLIVLDNMSIDDSIEWLRTLDDSRVTIIESQAALSIEDNWARIVDVPKREYMTIIGHDDLFDPNYLEEMNNLINVFPDAGLYQAHFRLIDGNGRTIRSCTPMPTTESAGDFLKSRFLFRRDSFGTGYMFRSVDYESVGGIPNYKKLMFADDALWLLLMKNSYKATSNTECFSYRVHAESTSYAPDWRLTYASLINYLGFLERYAADHKDIASVLQNQMRDFLIFWFRWAYFLTHKGSDEREDVKLEINRISKLVEDFPKNSQTESINSDVKKRVLGVFAYYRWLGWRCRRWLTNRFPHIFY